MKRSETQNIISKILDKHDGAIFDHDIVANEILTAMEDAGMKLVKEIQIGSGTPNSEGGEDWYMDVVIGYDDEETSEQFEQRIKDSCDSFQNMLESLDEEDKKSVNEWTWDEEDKDEEE